MLEGQLLLEGKQWVVKLVTNRGGGEGQAAAVRVGGVFTFGGRGGSARENGAGG